jgi:hypothetical protein
VSTTSPLEIYVQAAHDAGLPADQVERFVKAGYVAQPVQLPFHAAARQIDNPDNPNLLAIVGTRNSAKTHAVFSQVGIDDCQRYPGLKFLYLRNYRKSAAESLDDLASRLLLHTSHIKTEDGVAFPNGSRVVIGGFKDARDVDKFIGIEFDGVAIEEASLLTQEKIDSLFGSIRTSRVDGYRVRKYLTFNAGGVGYSYLKKLIIIPWKLHKETNTRMFYAHWKDNAFCDRDYIAYLDGLTGHLRRSWRDGDLDAFEGAAFPQWDENIHVCDPFQIPETWARWRAVDYGMNPDPFCCLWFARDLATGRMVIYDEEYGTGYTDTEQARLIATHPEKVSVTYAGRDMFSNRDRADGKKSTNADEYLKQGIMLTMADVNRVTGKRKIDRALGTLPSGTPGLQVFSSCYHWLETTPGLVLKPGTEDIADGQEDHAYDTTRYGLTNYQDIQPPKKNQPAMTKAEADQIIRQLRTTR